MARLQTLNFIDKFDIRLGVCNANIGPNLTARSVPLTASQRTVSFYHTLPVVGRRPDFDNISSRGRLMKRQLMSAWSATG